jgi:hypothetical protein
MEIQIELVIACEVVEAYKLPIVAQVAYLQKQIH